MSVTVSGKIEHGDLENIFSRNVQEVSFTKFYKSGNVEALNMAGSTFFFRSNDTIGFIFLSFYDGSEQKIDFGRVGGGSGILNIRWGAGNKLEENILQEIKQAADGAGVTVT